MVCQGIVATEKSDFAESLFSFLLPSVLEFFSSSLLSFHAGMSSYCNPYCTHFTGEKLKLQLKNLSTLLSRYFGILVS
jgi:hypothetical protein